MAEKIPSKLVLKGHKVFQENIPELLEDFQNELEAVEKGLKSFQRDMERVITVSRELVESLQGQQTPEAFSINLQGFISFLRELLIELKDLHNEIFENWHMLLAGTNTGYDLGDRISTERCCPLKLDLAVEELYATRKRRRKK